MACTLPACEWVNNPGLLLVNECLTGSSLRVIRGGEKMKDFPR